MKKVALIILTAIACILVGYGQQEATTATHRKVLLREDGTWVYTDSVPLVNLKPVSLQKPEIPAVSPKDMVITHSGYSLLYNETHEQAAWVAYELTKEETGKSFDRTDKFIPDPKVKTGTASDKDYAGSGYDRGHLAPAGDMGWSATAMAESFYYSNMSPQTPGFNRGVWKRLEELVRTWAVENNAVYVVTGPVLTAGLPAIGQNRVSVPDYFYKVILDYTEPGIKAIGFIIPNTGSKDPLQQFAVTVDSVEKFTGINFFPSLPDDQEELIEKTLCAKCWTWKSAKTGDDENTNSISVQCKGTTKKGEQCKNKTTNPSGYCYLHEAQQQASPANTQVKPAENRRPASVQCSGTTKAGARCKRMTYSPNGRCFQHGGN